MEDKMVREDSFFLSSSTNHRFFVRCHLPPGNGETAIVLIIPGMAEHAGRYTAFGRFLAGHNFSAYVCDHPGQGRTAAGPEELGRITDRRGWQVMLENVRALYTKIRKDRPTTPLFVFGHSMGSLLARHFTALYPVYIKGLVLSGSFELSTPALSFWLTIVRLKILLEGPGKKSKWFNNLFYWSFNRHFKQRDTQFHWISSLPEEVRRYVDDPFCGFHYSNGFYRILFKGIAATHRAEALLTYRKSLPVLILSGKEDPVGHFGRDAVKIHKEYYKQSFQNLSLKIFPGRHELLHEQNSQEVLSYVIGWLNESMKVR